jgi:hypothetical protein
MTNIDWTGLQHSVDERWTARSKENLEPYVGHVEQECVEISLLAKSQKKQ